MRNIILLAAFCVLAGCGGARRDPIRDLPAGVEAISVLGDTLRAPTLSAATRASYEARLDSARRTLAANPDDPDALIWVGRRIAYLGRYREAIATFTQGAERWPNDARFLRHRGHRWITLRQLGRAIADLERAADLVRGRPDQVEPDGLPNARGIPTSTLQSNIFYHLALARYLRNGRDDAAGALRALDQALRVSTNPDMTVATRYWEYLARRRAGDDRGARAVLDAIAPDMPIIENFSYHNLLLVFKGLLPLDSVTGSEGLDGATINFGLGAWLMAEGQRERALEFFRRARAGGQWPAFGYIAAEAALARAR